VRSVELNTRLSLEKPKLKISAEANYFYMPRYIIGTVDPSLSAMTIGADGVKVYRNLQYAQLFNTSLDLEYQMAPSLKWTGQISYHRGVDDQRENLPFIAPFTYRSGLQFNKNTFSGTLKMSGAAKQLNYNPDFGEDQTPAYTLFSISAGKNFYLHKDTMMVNFGIENIFDKTYSTYTDWKNIPRMGRNFFLTLSYSFN